MSLLSKLRGLKSAAQLVSVYRSPLAQQYIRGAIERDRKLCEIRALCVDDEHYKLVVDLPYSLDFIREQLMKGKI